MLGDAMSIFARSTRVAVRELARAHAREQVEVLLDAPVAVRRVRPGARQRAARLADLVGGLVVDERVPRPDQVDRPVVELLEVVGRVEDRSSPQSKPSQRTSASMASMYSCSSFSGLVSSNRRLQVPPNSLRDAEVEGDRLGMADVEVAVGLGREPRDEGGEATGGEVRGHDVADEVAALGGCGRSGSLVLHGGRG